MMDRKKMWIGGTAFGVAVIGGGAGVAYASGVGNDGESLTGANHDEVTQAALDQVGGGTVLEAENGDGGAAYEVEIRLDNGRVVEVHLNKSLEVVNQTPDDDGGEDESSEDEAENR